MVSGGDLAGASRLATTPGVLKPTAAGSQIKQLGRGSEGIASLVAHPEHGVAVRKLYDPRGISSPSMLKQKEEAGRAVGDNPHFAKFLGSAPTPHGSGTMHFNEYVPQAKQQASIVPSAAEQTRAQQIRESATQTARGARSALRGVGFEGHDIRKGNMALDQRTGQHKVIDYLPARPGQMETPNINKPHQVNVTPQGVHLVNDSLNKSTTKGMLGGMLGGNKPMGVRRYINASLDGNNSNAVGLGAGVSPFSPTRSPSSAAVTSIAKPPKPQPPSPTAEATTNLIRKPKPVPAIAPVQP